MTFRFTKDCCCSSCMLS